MAQFSLISVLSVGTVGKSEIGVERSGVVEFTGRCAVGGDVPVTGVLSYADVSRCGGDVVLDEPLQVGREGRIEFSIVGEQVDRISLSSSREFGISFYVNLGVGGELGVPGGWLEGVTLEQVVGLGFCPDVYAVRYIAENAGVLRTVAVDVLTAFRNLLELCEELGIAPVHAFCLKLSLGQLRDGRRVWIIEYK